MTCSESATARDGTWRAVCAHAGAVRGPGIGPCRGVWSAPGMSSIAVPARAADTDVSRAPGRSTLFGVAVAGLIVALGSLTLALRAEHSTAFQTALLEWISVPYIVAGLIAWWRRPD